MARVDSDFEGCTIRSAYCAVKRRPRGLANRLCGLGLPLMLLLTSCSGTVSHQPGSAMELRDEQRIILAAARSRLDARESQACVKRTLVAVPAFHALSTSNLLEIANQLRDRPAPAAALESRNLAAADLAALGMARAEAPCTGERFLDFGRVEFLGEVAVANAGEWRSDTCSVGPVLFRFEREGDGWRLADTHDLRAHSATSCTPEIRTRAEYFTVQR